MNRPETSLASIFAALANDDRLAMIREISAHPGDGAGAGRTVTAIAGAVGVSRFSASRHLRILCETGLVEVTRRGHALLHRLSPDGFQVVEDWLYALIDRSAGNPEFFGLPAVDRAGDAAR